MDEIEYKLKQNNPVLVLNAFSKLLSSTQKSFGTGYCSSQTNELSEIKLLKKKCEDANPVISQTACQAIVTLVEDGLLEIQPTMNEFISLIQFTSYHNGIIVAIARLLAFDLKMHVLNSSSRSKQSLVIHKSMQHPFIMLLKHKTMLWFDILNQMEMICNNPDLDISSNAISLLEPVFLYILCNPTSKLPDHCCQETWSLLLLQSGHSNDAKGLLIDIICWLQINSDDGLVSNSTKYLKLAKTGLESKDIALCLALAPSLASLAHGLIQGGHDPRVCLQTLDNLLLLGPEANSLVLMLLAETVGSCPAVYFKDLLSTCLSIIEKGSYNVMSGQMLFCSLLQWLVYPSYLANHGLQLANKILQLIQTRHTNENHSEYLFFDEWFCQLQNADHRIDFVTKLCKLTEDWKENKLIILPWLDRLVETPSHFSEKFYLFLSALFVYGYDIDEVKISSYMKLLDISTKSRKFSTTLVPIILYKLTEEKRPVFHLELLRGLTSMAYQKENIPIVVSTLESLKGAGSLQSIVLDLHVRLWRVDGRCYSYLQPLLMAKSKVSNEDETWKHEIAKAAAIHEICIARPEYHGTELVALLSQMLNQCVDGRQSLAASFALQAITALCQADIVDIITTWKVIARKLNKDYRVHVLVSLCEFLSAIPSICSAGGEYERFSEEAIAKLWDFVSTNGDTEVIIAAFKAIGKFDLEQMSLRSLPRKYCRKPEVSEESAEASTEEVDKPEEALQYIRGECWILMLDNVNTSARESAGNVLIGWMAAELNAYRGGVYQIPHSGEPSNCHHLHQRSIYRALTDHLWSAAKKLADVEAYPLINECLRILGHKYSKPLPPFNWSFMQDFLSTKVLRKNCLVVTAKQAATSPSAKRFIENYISMFKPSIQLKEEILELASVLPDLCIGIAPNTIRPILEKILDVAVADASREDCEEECILNNLFGHIKSALKTNIQDANRALLSLLLEGLLDKLSIEHHCFPGFVDCIVELPTTNLEKMTSPSLWWEVTRNKVRQSIMIRGCLARRSFDGDTPLVWLNECIDVTAEMASDQIHMLREISAVMVACRNHKGNWRWIIELLGKIQSVMCSGRKETKQPAVEFLCNVLLVAIIVLSSHDCLVPSLDNIVTSYETRLLSFPQALATLVANTEEDPSQLMEWLHHMQRTKSVSPLYNAVFRQSLVALRHVAYFHEPAVADRFIIK